MFDFMELYVSSVSLFLGCLHLIIICLFPIFSPEMLPFCLFLQLAMKWLDFDASRQTHAAELLSHVRFETIPASELVSQIQPVPRMMMDPQCHRLLVDAMNYHLLPYQQNTLQSRRTQVRGGQQTLLTVGGRPSLTERALSREVGASCVHLLCIHHQRNARRSLTDL